MKYPSALALAATLALTGSAFAQAPTTAKPTLNVKAEGIGSDGYIEPDYAYCIPAASGHVKEGNDKSIGLYWSGAPAGTKSFAIIGVDTDVPTVFDDAGKEGKILSASMPRRNFYHWVLFDIPKENSQIPANTDSNGMVQHGKTELKTPYGTRGVNDYAPFMASNPDKKGVYAGYDGPCPPWNDALVHHYHFKVLALDVASLDLKGQVTGTQAEAAIAPHIIAQGEVVGLYTLNPAVKK
jgi:Raf kinase inhibitor-like YbhB/YbcL family protein